jgi:hypothetical protein
VICLTASAVAQTTSVTLQATDADAQTWNNGTWTASLYSPPGVPNNKYVITATGVTVPNQQQSGNLNTSGAGSLTVTPNIAISPSGTQWQFSFCPQAAPSQCQQYSTSITGASQTVAPALPAIRISAINPVVRVTAYTDTEISGANAGTFYFNLTDLSIHFCTAATGQTCTLWSPFLNTIALASPPPIGNVTPNAGYFTNITISGACTGKVVAADGTGCVVPNGLPTGVASGSAIVSNGIGQQGVYQTKPALDPRDYGVAGTAGSTTTTGTNAAGTTITVASCPALLPLGLPVSPLAYGVNIAGAGAAGTQYVGTIVSCPSGGPLVVSPATSTSVSAGALVQADDTVAAQNFVNAGCRSGAGTSSVLQLPPATVPGGWFQINLSSPLIMRSCSGLRVAGRAAQGQASQIVKNNMGFFWIGPSGNTEPILIDHTRDSIFEDFFVFGGGANNGILIDSQSGTGTQITTNNQFNDIFVSNGGSSGNPNWNAVNICPTATGNCEKQNFERFSTICAGTTPTATSNGIGINYQSVGGAEPYGEYIHDFQGIGCSALIKTTFGGTGTALLDIDQGITSANYSDFVCEAGTTTSFGHVRSENGVGPMIVIGRATENNCGDLTIHDNQISGSTSATTISAPFNGAGGTIRLVKNKWDVNAGIAPFSSPFFSGEIDSQDNTYPNNTHCLQAGLFYTSINDQPIGGTCHFGSLHLGSANSFLWIDSVAFGNAIACSSTTEGMIKPFTDSTTDSLGATITGGGSKHVEGYCNGTNWVVGVTDTPAITTANTITSTLPTGTPPLSVASETPVLNLNTSGKALWSTVASIATSVGSTPTPGLGAINVNTSISSTSLALNINVGDTVVIFLNVNGAVPTITDNGSSSNTYVQVGSTMTGSGHGYAFVCTSAGFTATTVTSSTATPFSMAGATFVNVSALGAVHSTVNSSGFATDSVTTTAPYSLVVTGFQGNFTTYSATTGTVIASALNATVPNVLVVQTVPVSGTVATNSGNVGGANWQDVTIELKPTPTAITAATYSTATNCAVNSASPAACGSAAAGAVVVPTTTTTYTVNTTAVTAASRIQLTPMSFAGNLPSAPTCVVPTTPFIGTISAISAGVSFTMTLPSTTGQTCWQFLIVN